MSDEHFNGEISDKTRNMTQEEFLDKEKKLFLGQMPDDDIHQLREKIDAGQFEYTIDDWLRVYHAAKTIRGSINPYFDKHNVVSDDAKNDFSHLIGKLGYNPKSGEIVEDFVFRNGTASAKRSVCDWNDICMNGDLNYRNIYADSSLTAWVPNILNKHDVTPTDIMQNLIVGNKEITRADKQCINEYFRSKWYVVEEAANRNAKFVDKRRGDINSGKYEKYLNKQEIEYAKYEKQSVPLVFNKQDLNQMLDEYVKKYNDIVYDINSGDMYREVYVFEHTDPNIFPECTRNSIGNMSDIIDPYTREVLGNGYEKYCQNMDNMYKDATEPSFYFDRAYRDDWNGMQEGSRYEAYNIFTPISVYDDCMDELRSKKREEIEKQQGLPRSKRRLPDIVETTDDEQSLEVE